MPTNPNIDKLLAGFAPPTTPSEPAPPPAPTSISPEDKARIPKIVNTSIDKLLAGYAEQIRHPGVTGHTASDFEKAMVRESAGSRLENALQDQSGLLPQAVEQVTATSALEQALPDIRQRVLGQRGTTMLERGEGALKSALTTGMSALDVVASQLDRPANVIRAGIRASLQHKDIVSEAMSAGGYGWREGAARVAFEDILKELGWTDDEKGQDPSTNLGPGLARGVAALGTLGLSETLPALGLHKPIDFEAYAPHLTARSVVGFVGSMLTDPLTYYTGGVGAARQLFKSGRYLNKLGELTHDTVYMMKYLADSPETVEWLAQRGAPEVVQQVRNASRLAAGHLANPTSQSLLAVKPEIEKAVKSLESIYQESVLSGRGGEIPYALTNHVSPQPLTRDEWMQSLMDRSQESMEKLLDKEGRTLEEVGGLKIGGVTLVPGKPAAELAAKTLKAVGRKASAGLEWTGEMVQSGLEWEKLGRGIKGIAAGTQKTIDNVAELFNTKWRLPGHFSRYLDSRFRGVMHGVEVRTIKDIESATQGLNVAEKKLYAHAMETPDPLGTYLSARPGLSPEEAALHTARLGQIRSLFDEAFKLEYNRGMLEMGQYNPQYVPHFYHNMKRVEEYFKSQGHDVVNPRDPSTYQRLIPTLHEAKALGFDPEEDIGKILAMRLINARRAALTQDFLTGSIGTFGAWARKSKQVVKREGRMLPEETARIEATIENMVVDAREAAISAGKPVGPPPSTVSLIKNGIFDLSDSGMRTALAERLVAEGARDAHFIGGLPDDMQREFLRQHFIKAALGSKQDMVSAKAEFAALRQKWPGGGGVEPGPAAIGLPSPQPGDGAWVRREIPGIGEAWLPERIHRKIHEIQQPHFFGDHGQAFEGILKLYEGGLLNFARKVATAPRLAFHFRNATSNTVMSAMDIGIEVLNPSNMADAISVLRGNNNKIITFRNGLKMSSLDLRREFINNGGYNLFSQRAHLGYGTLGEAVAAEVAADQGPLRFANPLWLGSRFGNIVENDARLVHYIALRKDGLSSAQALQRVHQFLFDYSDLTPFEKSVMRRLMLFYTWPKKALPVLGKTLVAKPRHFMGYSRFIDAMQGDDVSPERRVVERQLLPEYVRSQYGIRIGPAIEAGALEAKKFMETFIGKEVILSRDVTQPDRDPKYPERALRYVHTAEDGQFLNELTLQKKLGTEFMMKINASNAATPEKATIERVIDGDTVIVKKADGSLDKVRLLGTNTPEISGSHIIRWFMGLDLPQAELNDLWNGNMQRTLQHWTDQVGPVPDVVAGLWNIVREKTGEITPQEREDNYAKTYSMLKMTLTNPSLRPIADFLDVREHFSEAENKFVIQANKNRVKGLISIFMLDPALREIDRGFSKDDSIYTALARYLTGGSFTETDPTAKEASATVKALKFMQEQGAADQRQMEYELQRRAMENEPLQGGPQ